MHFHDYNFLFEYFFSFICLDKLAQTIMRPYDMLRSRMLRFLNAYFSNFKKFLESDVLEC